MTREFLIVWILLLLLACPAPAISFQVPDTGQSKCYDNEKEITCPGPGRAFYGQDTQNQPRLPRSYTKLGHDGKELPSSAAHADNGGEWIMTRDNVTGLVWELKTAANKNDKYPWDEALEYAQILNLGGFSDWRLPDVKELHSLLFSEKSQPTIDAAWFPNTTASWYWSSTSTPNSNRAAWRVDFGEGFDNINYKVFSGYVMAVRGGHKELENVFIDNGDGTVTDIKNGLMWTRCNLGETWNGSECSVSAGLYNWKDALANSQNLNYAGYSDWRLPNRNELKTLTEYSREDLAIDTAIFPSTPTKNTWYWTSTTNPNGAERAWLVYFINGRDENGYKINYAYVRAVRSVQDRVFGSLSVRIEPAKASEAGAQWRRDGSTIWRKSGDIETGVPAGLHNVEFSAADDWSPPSEQKITVTAGKKSQLTGVYEYRPEISSSRAAILVLPRGYDENDTQALRIMVVDAYNTLRKRRFRSDEIYLLAYTPMIGTSIFTPGYDDIVSAPVTLEDYRNDVQRRDIKVEDVARAFAWAKTKGSLAEPLLFKFVGHGFEDGGELRLDHKRELLTGEALNAMIDEYQVATGNKVAVVIEACYAGLLLPQLSGLNRIIITSTNENQARVIPAGLNSVTSYTNELLKELRMGKTYYEAFEKASRELRHEEYKDVFMEQFPQLDDNGDGVYDENDGNLARQYSLNLSVTLDLPIVLDPLIIGRKVHLGESVVLKVDVGLGAQKVWATIVTPETLKHWDNNGYPLKPSVNLSLNKKDDGVWHGTFNGFDYQGNYMVIFNAINRDGFVFKSTPVVFTLENAPEASAEPVPSSLNYQTGDHLRVRIPAGLQGYTTYVALTVPGFNGLIFIRDLNDFVLFDGKTLPTWHGVQNTVMDFTVVEALPKGTYTAYLLFIPTGQDPLSFQADTSTWKIGHAEFKVE